MARSSVVAVVITLILASPIAAFQLFPTGAVALYPTACGNALSQNISACNKLAEVLDPYTTYDQKTLNQTCSSACGTALTNWYSSAVSACGNITYSTDEGFFAPISAPIGEIVFNYNETCLQYGGQYCNLIIGQQLNATINANASNGTTSCDMCNLYRLRDFAQSPYGDGPLIYSQSIYQSYTSSCGGSFTKYPLSTSPPPATPTASTTSSAASGSASTTTTAAACTGTTYSIKSGDTCNAVATSQGTSLGWLLLDNNLQAKCANFPTSGSLCINHPCKAYTVKAGDTCAALTASNNITQTQLTTWNPWIDTSCYNFNRTIGTSICVGQPGTNKYVTPSGIAGAPTTAISAAPVPTSIAPNTTTNCGKYYYVQGGDDCNHVTVKFGIALQDFYILNQGINANCTNLWLNTSYCVQPVGSINNYPGSPFYGISNLNNTSAPPFSNYTNATYLPVFPTRAAGALAPGTAQGCYRYFDGSQLIFNYTGNSDCNAVAFKYSQNITNLQRWNPSLQTNSSSCTFVRGLSYCIVLGQGVPVNVSYVPLVTANGTASSTSGSVSLSSSMVKTSSSVVITSSSTTTKSTTSSTTTTPAKSSSTSTSTSTSSTPSAPSPTQSGSISRNCNAYAKVPSGQGCYDFATANKISTAHLYDWNSVLGYNGANCGTALQANVYYCIGVNIPSPTQANSIPENCDLYAVPASGQGCYDFAAANNITTDQLYSWNTVLGTNGANCGTALQAKTYYCVGTNGAKASTG